MEDYRRVTAAVQWNPFVSGAFLLAVVLAVLKLISMFAWVK
jgi:hypothetical protein